MIWKRVSRVGLARWRPAAFTAIDVRFTSWFLVVIALARGVDYLRSGRVDLSAALATVEKAFPIVLWGYWFCAGALVLAAGVILRRHFVVWCGYTILFVAWGLLGVGLLVPYLPFDVGLRTGVLTIYIAMIHFLLMLRTGPVPLVSGDTHTTSRMQAGNE